MNEEQRARAGQQTNYEQRSPDVVWLTIAAALVFALLVGLGIWQLQRKTWKEGLIEQLQTRLTAPPVTLANVVARIAAGEDVEYTRVRVKGRFLHNKEHYFYAPDQRLGPGYHVYTPFELAGGGSITFINRGYVPDGLKAPLKRIAGQVAGEVAVIGLVRAPVTRAFFTPENDITGNLWYWRDLDALLASAFGNNGPASVALFVDAEQPAPGGWPKGGATIVSLPNKHFSYALTWFGLAATLIGVYAALVWSRRRPN